MRVTYEHLEDLVSRLNKLTNSPETLKTDGKHNKGHFTLYNSANGYEVHRITNTSGAVDTPLGDYALGAKEMARVINVFIRGIKFNQYQND
jgi:hypothetical protein